MSDRLPAGLHHLEIGTGRRPVVFLHGLFGQGKNFTQIAKALVAQVPSLCCLLVDLPNHGRSIWTEQLDYAQMADRVAEFLTEVLSSRPAVVVGHSMGGKVAMQLALRHPALVEALVVVDISPVATDQVTQQFGHLVAAMRGLDLPALTSRSQAEVDLTAAIPDPVVRGFLLQNLRHDHRAPAGEQWHWQMNLGLLGDELAQVGTWHTAHQKSYSGPVVWVAGADSPYIVPDHGPIMRSLFPKAQLVTVKNSGHWVHSEQPDAFVSILRHVLSPSPRS